jgi:hypothetical protein
MALAEEILQAPDYMKETPDAKAISILKWHQNIPSVN